MQDGIRTLIATNIGLIDRLKTSLSPKEADLIAGEFLKGIAELSAYRLEFSSRDYTVACSVYLTTRKKAWLETEGKTAKDKEIASDANPELLKALETQEIAEHNLKYINSIIDVFNNAHIQFRQVSNNLSKNAF